MKIEIDLASRWEFNPRDGFRGILVHGLAPGENLRVGISYYEGEGCAFSSGVSTTFRDRRTQNPIRDAKDWVAEAGAVVVGELTIPVIEGRTSHHIVNGNPFGYFYLLVTEESHSEMVDYFKRMFQK